MFSLVFAGSYADYTVSSNRSDDNTEHRNSVGREETLKSFEAKFPLQFKPSKVAVRTLRVPLSVSTFTHFRFRSVPLDGNTAHRSVQGVQYRQSTRMLAQPRQQHRRPIRAEDDV